MSMFCYQCQEAAKGTGCTIKGVCGKTDQTSNLQDLLIYISKGVSVFANIANSHGLISKEADKFIIEALFMTITNANFDNEKITDKIEEGIKIRNRLKASILKKGLDIQANLPDCTYWEPQYKESIFTKSILVSILNNDDEDIRSLKELLVYGIKGMAAYADHALNLGHKNSEIYLFIHKGLAESTREDITVDELIGLVLECGKYGVDVMALLDKANTDNYGHPELSKVNLGVRNNPAILISGHDLKDIEELLEQTQNTGVDVYTHSEMLPAHYYPAFKKYEHFVGNYGNAWWKQNEEFDSFNGPVLLTTNCLTPPKSSYIERVYTTGSAGFEGVKHIKDRKEGEAKDFSIIIEHAKKCPPPKEIESGEIVGGFAHNQVIKLADKVVEAVKNGAIKKFLVMAGCDGRMKGRDYYAKFAEKLPNDTIILTAGCAKFRYNKLQLGDIGGIPRVLDAGQCNDSYSLAVVALKLKEIFELNDINELPIAYNIAWYEQKAVIVLLALLHLGVKNIHLGPTLPAFLSPNVAKVLSDNFGISGITNVEEDIKKLVFDEVEV